MATAVRFVRNRAPHFAGDAIGTDPVMADRLVRAGYATHYDIDAEARASAPAEAATDESDGEGKGGKQKPAGK